MGDFWVNRAIHLFLLKMMQEGWGVVVEGLGSVPDDFCLVLEGFG